MPSTTSDEIAVHAAATAAARPHAAAAVWDWRRAEGPASAVAEAARLRRRAVVEAMIGAALGGLAYLWRPALAYVVWSVATFTLIAGLGSPTGLYARIHRLVGWLGHAIGQVLAVVLLTPLFFGFFAVFGAVFRRGRRDRMEPRFDPRVPTYWKRRRDGERTLADFERMF